jgi:zinc/manganese transport system substrate-binding protein
LITIIIIEYHEAKMRSPSPPRTYLLAGLLLALTASSCSSPGVIDDDDLSIVVTTTVLGDVLENIVGLDARVTVLLPIESDPHEFTPSAQQIAQIHSADLVVANGLGLEAGLLDVLETASTDGANVYTVADRVTNEPNALGGPDPHIWLDPTLMALAVDLIGEQIALADPDSSIDWSGRASAYASQLLAAHQSVVETLAAVPQDRRLIVTNHDSLHYFAEAYDFEVIGTVFPGRSPVGEPSSEDLANLVDILSENQLTVIFGETTEASSLAQAVAAELGGAVQVVELHTGSLGGPGSGAETYIDLLSNNARLIADALGS